MKTRGEICIELGKNVCRNCFHFDPPNEESALCLRYPPVWADGEWTFPEVQRLLFVWRVETSLVIVPNRRRSTRRRHNRPHRARKGLTMKISADIYNLTPHPITIDDGKNKLIYDPFPVKELPRVHIRTTKQDEVNGIRIRTIKPSSVTHLPEYEDGTLYIVSAMVAQAVPHRSDLICPDTKHANRDEKGFIVSVKGFVSYTHSQIGTPPGVPSGMDWEPWREHENF